MNQNDVQEAVFSIAGTESSDEEIGVLTLIPPKRPIFIESISVLMDTAGASGSTVHVALSSATSTALVEVDTTTTDFTTNSADTRGFYRRAGSSAEKLVVQTGSTAPGETGTVVVKFAIAPTPASA